MAQPEVVQSGPSPSFLSGCIFGLSVFLLQAPLSCVISCLSSAFITDKLLVFKKQP